MLNPTTTAQVVLVLIAIAFLFIPLLIWALVNLLVFTGKIKVDNRGKKVGLMFLVAVPISIILFIIAFTI